MELGLYQQQTMKLVMTQELRQAITILQYSGQELIEYIREQALENPLIELQDPKIEEPVQISPSYDYSSSHTPAYRSNSDCNPFDFIQNNEKDTLQEDLLQQARYLDLD